MNFGQIYAEIGNFTPNNSGTQRDKMLSNWAYHNVNTARRWSWLESSMTIALVAGQKGYVILGTTPQLTDADGVYDVELVMTAAQSTQRLPYANPQMFSEMFSHTFTNSQPVAWTILGGTPATTPGAVVSGGQQLLTLSHPPVATAGAGVSLLVKYWRSMGSTEMSADSDVPIMPVQYHDLIVQRGIVRAYEQQHQYELSTRAEQRYEEMLMKADITDGAGRFSDFFQLEFKTLPQLDNRVPPTTYRPDAIPYPVAQA